MSTMMWRSVSTSQARRGIAPARCTSEFDGRGGSKKVVLGFGSVCVDYLAQVAHFPAPDEKMRTETMQMQGGGNVGNALTGASKLGVRARLMSKIGNDGVGQSIVDELRAAGVETPFLIVQEGAPSPFTYVIVDREGASRTCIHTPGPPLMPEELDPKTVESVLDGVALVYFDGRLTEAALELMKAAKRKKIPTIVEAERLRPNLEELLEQADYVFTSAQFPIQWTGEEVLGEALLATAARLPEAKFILTTLGSRGSVMLDRPDDLSWSTSSIAKLKKKAKELKVSMADVVAAALPDMPSTPIHKLLSEMMENRGTADAVYLSETAQSLVGVDSIGQKDTKVGLRTAPSTSSFFKLETREPTASRLQHRKDAATGEAAANANAGAEESYSSDEEKKGRWDLQAGDWVCGRLIYCPAADLPVDAVVDTTGAGDAFMASILYGLVSGLEYEKMMALGSVVAAIKCGGLGARSALPSKEDVHHRLLQ